MFSNSILISWRVRAVHLFCKVIFVKMEFVKRTSVLFDYLRYIKKKRDRQSLFSGLLFRSSSSFLTSSYTYLQRCPSTLHGQLSQSPLQYSYLYFMQSNCLLLANRILVILVLLYREAACYALNLVQRVYPGIFLCVLFQLLLCDFWLFLEPIDDVCISVVVKSSDFITV